MTKLYRSKSAAIRHAINCLGAEWETEAFINEAPIPGGEFIYSVHMKDAPRTPSRPSEPISPAKTLAHPRIPRSRIDSPKSRARAIADRMAGQPRRAIIAACERAGIATGTAATQYQQWRAEHRKR